MKRRRPVSGRWSAVGVETCGEALSGCRFMSVHFLEQCLYQDIWGFTLACPSVLGAWPAPLG